MRVAFLSLYNQYAHGARYIMSWLEKHGHQTMLVKVKRFVSEPVARGDVHKRRAIEQSGHLPVFEIHPFGDCVCPYPHDLTPHELEIFIETMSRFEPDVIALSITSSHMPLTIQLSRELRRRFPKVPQVWGGIHATMDPVGCLEWADVACVGEGEEGMLEYLADPHRTDIQNLQFKDRDGAIVQNPMRRLNPNLDEFPMPMFGGEEYLIEEDRLWTFDQLHPDEAAGQLILSSQRGCPFSCSYCLHGEVRDMYSGQKYLRRKSVDLFLDEIEERLRQYPLEELVFWDDVFMMHPQWIEEFADKYPKRFNLPFGGNCHPRTTSRRILEDLARAGCTFVTIGVQTGSDYIGEKVYGRHISNDHFVKFGEDLKDLGYQTLVFDVLTRCVFEREQDLRDTVMLLSRMPKPEKISVKELVMFPFSAITKIKLPHGNVAPEVYHFYDMLYLLAAQPGFDNRLLARLVDDQHLRAHPEIVEAWVQQLARAAEDQQRADRELTAVRRERENLTRRVAGLEHQMPWGIKRAGKHLLNQVGRKLGLVHNGNGHANGHTNGNGAGYDVKAARPSYAPGHGRDADAEKVRMSESTCTG